MSRGEKIIRGLQRNSLRIERIGRREWDKFRAKITQDTFESRLFLDNE
jgi:hypothetical protein